MLEHKREGILIIVSGPSGAGKGTLCKHIREQIELSYSISATTRAPREGEVDGEDYFFLDKKAFLEQIKQDGFLEWAEVYGNYYGTPTSYIKERLRDGHDVMIEIDPQGAKQVKAKNDQAVLVFIMPPSFAELERRIRGRGTETEEQICRRLAGAMDEINTLNAYDYVIVNDDIGEAVWDLRTIINAEKCRVAHNRNLPAQFREEKESNNDSTEHR